MRETGEKKDGRRRLGSLKLGLLLKRVFGGSSSSSSRLVVVN